MTNSFEEMQKEINEKIKQNPKDTSIYKCYGDASLHYYNAEKVNEGHVAEGIINNYRKKNFN